MQIGTYEEQPSADVGHIDFCVELEGSQGTFLWLSGWARDPATGRPGRSVLVTDEKRNVLAEGAVTGYRPDVASYYQDPLMNVCGWSVVLPKSALSTGEHHLSAYTVDHLAASIAYKLCGSFPVVSDGCRASSLPPNAVSLPTRPRPHTRDENERLNRDEQAAGRTALDSFPTSLLLELTLRCNLNCIMCYRYNSDLDGEIPEELYKQVKATLFPRIKYVNFASRGGEPTLYSKWDEVVQDVRSYGIKANLVTNGVLLNSVQIRELVDAGFSVDFSIDAAEPRTYQYVRGASLSAVAKHVQEFVSYARSCGNRTARAAVRFTPMLVNLREMPEMIDRVAEWGIDTLKVQKFNAANAYVSKQWSPENDPVVMKGIYDETARRAADRHVTLFVGEELIYEAGVPEVPPFGCMLPFSDAIVLLDGRVATCCFGAPPMGHLQYQSFEQIWNGEPWRKLRKGLATGDPPDFCKRCHLLGNARARQKENAHFPRGSATPPDADPAPFRRHLQSYPDGNFVDLAELEKPAGPNLGDIWRSPSTGMEFAYIPAGEFDMGSESEEALDEEKPVHRVRISRSFYIGKYPVMQREWEAVMGSNPSHFKGPKLPVECVSWNSVQEFLKKLSKAGEEGYRLPTEAEWEYAARAGAHEDRYANAEEIGWYRDNSVGSTNEVGLKQPNSFGLYDMLGNVWEWCQDWYGEYPKGAATDPRGPSSGQARILRGGSWYTDPKSLHVSYRVRIDPKYWYINIGFRCVRDVEPGRFGAFEAGTPG